VSDIEDVKQRYRRKVRLYSDGRLQFERAKSWLWSWALIFAWFSGGYVVVFHEWKWILLTPLLAWWHWAVAICSEALADEHLRRREAATS